MSRKNRDQKSRIASDTSHWLCLGCSEALPMSDYYLTPSGTPYPRCKACQNAYNVEYLRTKGRSKLYQRKYGISWETVESMIEEQGNACLICRDPLESPHVDHCHTSGKVRGILCIRCNSGLGMFRDRPDLLLSAVRYLENAS